MKPTILILIVFAFSKFAIAQDPALLATFNDIRRYDQVINLDPSLDPSQIYLTDANSAPKGYEVFATRKINTNLYGYVTSNVGIVSDSSDFYNSFGLFPVIERYVSISKKVQKMSDFTFKIPYSASDVEALSVGDAIYFQSTGGITMYLTLGIGYVGIGPKVWVQGGFTTYIEKKEDNKVFVEIRQTNIKSYSFLAKTTLGAFAEKAIRKNLTKGVNFLIDLSTIEGKRVYEDLVQTGRGDLAQESTSTVTRVGEVSSQRVTKFTKFALATPIIPFIELSTTHVSETRSEQRSNIWNQNSSATTYLKGKRKTKRIFSRKSETSKIFETTEDVLTGAIESASLTIKKSKSNYTTRSLVRSLRYFYRKTGINFFQEVFLNFSRAYLGYGKVEAKLSLSNRSIQFLRESYGETINAQGFSSLSKQFTKNDNFKNLLEVARKCGGELKLTLEGRSITRSIVKDLFETQPDC